MKKYIVSAMVVTREYVEAESKEEAIDKFYEDTGNCYYGDIDESTIEVEEHVEQ